MFKLYIILLTACIISLRIDIRAWFLYVPILVFVIQ